MTTQTVFDQALEALAILRVNRTVQLSHSSQAKVAGAVSALLAAKQATVDASPSPVSVQPVSEQGLDAAIAKIIQMSASLGLETLLPKAREIIRALSTQPAQPISSDVQEPVASLGGHCSGFTNEFGQRVCIAAQTVGGRRMTVWMDRDDDTVFSVTVSDLEGMGLLRALRSLFCASPAPDVRPSAPVSDAESLLRKLVDTYFTNNCGENLHNLMDGARVRLANQAQLASVPGVKVASEPLDLFGIFEAGWSFHHALQGHVFDGRDVGRLTVCEFWPPILQGMHVGTDLHVGLSVSAATVRLKQEVKRRLSSIASQPAAPVQQEPGNDVGTDYECSACGKLNYRPNGCGNCGLEYEDAAPAPRVSADSPTTANAGDQEGGGA